MPSVDIIKTVEDLTGAQAARAGTHPGPCAHGSPHPPRSLKNTAGETDARTEYGQSSDYSVNDALWACSNVFADVTSKVASRRIFLFTNNDQPHATRPDLEVHAAAPALGHARHQIEFYRADTRPFL